MFIPPFLGIILWNRPFPGICTLLKVIPLAVIRHCEKTEGLPLFRLIPLNRNPALFVFVVDISRKTYN
jgi:hypothetical protein